MDNMGCKTAVVALIGQNWWWVGKLAFGTGRLGIGWWRPGIERRLGTRWQLGTRRRGIERWLGTDREQLVTDTEHIATDTEHITIEHITTEHITTEFIADSMVKHMLRFIEAFIEQLEVIAATVVEDTTHIIDNRPAFNADTADSSSDNTTA